MLYDCKRISCWIDRRLSGLAVPDYDAPISFGLPFELQDCQYGKSRLKFSRSDPESSRDIRFPQNKGRKRSERLPNETEPIRTNAYQTEVQVKNYWLEYQFEKKKAHLPWDLRACPIVGIIHRARRPIWCRAGISFRSTTDLRLRLLYTCSHE